MQSSPVLQQALPQMSVGWQQVPAMGPVAMQSSTGSQQALPQTLSGSQQVPASGPMSMQVLVLSQQLTPTHIVLPGLQHNPISKFRQVSLTRQQESPQPTGQQGAPVMLQAEAQVK